MRVLIIDDEVAVRTLIARAFGDDGWQAEVAADGQAARAMLERSPYEAIVCDVDLGAEDGIVLARRLKSSSPLTRVIVVSGRPENRERARLFGFEYFLEKPFDLPELLALARSRAACGTSRARDGFAVLLVEDDTRTLDSLRRGLESFGWRVTPVQSAEAGLEAARDSAFDVILTDHVLPGMSGLRSISEYAKLTRAPVVVMTQDYSDSLAADAALLGARRTLRKPLSAEAVRLELEAAVARA